MPEADHGPSENPTGADGPGSFVVDQESSFFSGRIISLSHLVLSDPNGQVFERDVVRHPGAVAIVALHADRQVCLVRQYRAAVGTSVLELPAGTRDVAGEDPETTARRELAEEAGLEADHLERLVEVYNSPGYSDQRTVIYLATGLHQVPTARQGVEESAMTIEKVSVDAVEDLVAEGRVLDETTVLGLLLARTRTGTT